MAIDYAREVLGLQFPEIIHGCGAGTSTIFLDNHGRVYSCDRVRNYIVKEHSMLNEDFKDIWKSEEFAKPFSVYYGDEIYKNLEPYNKCKYLYNECFPCYLTVNGAKSVMRECNFFEEEMRKSNKVS